MSRRRISMFYWGIFTWARDERAQTGRRARWRPYGGRCLVAAALLCCGQGIALGATIKECQDAQGRKYFADRCPADTQQLGEKKILTSGQVGGGVNLQKLRSEHPIVIYSVPNCDACDLTRNYLSKRGLPFSEKDVSENAENQQELKERSGALTVPAVAVGKQLVSGYNRSALKSQLDAVGYPDSESQQGQQGQQAADATPANAEPGQEEPTDAPSPFFSPPPPSE